MEIRTTELEGVLLISPDIYRDERGLFMETYSHKKYSSYGLKEIFVQDNYSHSKKSTIRGLHYQLNKPQGKLVRVAKGCVLDVALDIRLNSPTFGDHVLIELDDVNFNQLYLPPGIAHGFYVKSEFADLEYKCTDYYDSKDQYGVLYSDPSLGINFPNELITISDQDKDFLPLSRIPKNHLPRFSPK